MSDRLISRNISLSVSLASRQKIMRHGLLFVAAFFAFASIVWAQPAMSRGEQLLSISYDECIRRAERAYINEGWVNIGKGGAFVNAFKENHGAYIMCNVAPENKVWANIVVASTSGDSGVPGAERVKLQKWMNQSGEIVSALSGKWLITQIIPPEQSYAGSYSVVADITEKDGVLSGSGTWAHGSRSTFSGEIRNGEIFLYRTDSGGFRGDFRGKVKADGSWEGTGKNDPSSPGGNSSSYTWTAVRKQ